MKRIAIFGKTGMLGSAVLDIFLKNNLNIISTDRNHINAETSASDDIEKILKGCDFAINCIGIIKPYIHDNNSFKVQRAIKVNALFPHTLSKAAEKTGTKIIQIATDCVYDGIKGSYVETDLHNALDVYGKTKSLGEVKSENVLNLRCSIIGREQKNYLSLLEWFLNQEKNAKVNGFLNHYWNGVTTLAFAKLCLGIIKNDFWFSGLQHIVPNDIINKADLLKIFAKTFNRKTFNREDITITDINLNTAVYKAILTVNKEKNKELWKLAGYEKIPTIGRYD